VKARRVDDRDAESSAEVRLRATVVAEREGEAWRIVQAHVSAPIRDQDLGAAVLGAARADDGTVRCDGPLPTAAPPALIEPAPAEAAPAAPTTLVSPPAARPAPSPTAAGSP
jgi:hypothetical protein